MNVTALELDVPQTRALRRADANAFGTALTDAASALEGADAAETDFAQRRAGLQEAVIARAKADVMLQIATTAASRTTQALSSMLNMQV